MTETDIINLTALEWVEDGGDSVEFDYLKDKIRERIVELEKAKEQERSLEYMEEEND